MSAPQPKPSPAPNSNHYSTYYSSSPKYPLFHNLALAKKTLFRPRLAAIALAAIMVLAALPNPMTSSAQARISPTQAVDRVLGNFAPQEPGGSILVIHNGRILLKKSYGLAAIERPSRANSRTTYRLASVSKQFTATAILLLAERGKLSLDDPLTKVFPDFPAHGRQVLIRHLLNHTSGLLDYEDLIPEDRKLPVVDADVLEILQKQQKPYFPPGSKWRYSNSGYALLACIVEKISGVPYPEFLARNIFRPLGMRSTFLTRRDQLTGGRRALGYSKRNGAWVNTDQSMTSFVLGDGGIYSSIEDLAKWEAALTNHRLLPRETLAQMMSSTAETSTPNVSYGYGWYVGKYTDHTALWHDGTTSGFRNHYLRIPEKKLTIILLANRTDIDAAALTRRVADAFLQ